MIAVSIPLNPPGDLTVFNVAGNTITKGQAIKLAEFFHLDLSRRSCTTNGQNLRAPR